MVERLIQPLQSSYFSSRNEEAGLDTRPSLLPGDWMDLTAGTASRICNTAIERWAVAEKEETRVG
jgi:hypothetical protein